MSWLEVGKAEWSQRGGLLRDLPDPYLVWAHLTSWADLGGVVTGHDGISLLIELNPAATAAQLRKALETALPANEFFMPGAYVKTRYLTLWLRRRHLSRLDSACAAGKLIRRFEISSPIVPGRAPTPPALDKKVRTRKNVLMGVIDSGCPFAHSAFIDKTGGTRISSLWDMNPDSSFSTEAPLKAKVEEAMGYGLEVTRQGINALLVEHRRASGIDEAAVYESARYRELRQQVSHGAHVLDVLAGPVPLRHRIYASRAEAAQSIHTDPDSPPTWADAGEPVSNSKQTDIVFAQLPRAALQDGTGGWLGSHVLDAAMYLLSCAGGKTSHVVVTVSYGCTTGPHDGSSILESALQALAEPSRGQPKTQFVMAAGNSFGEDGHAVLRQRHCTHNGEPLVWRVLPGGEAPSFVQVWFPKGSDAKGFRITVKPPGAAPATLVPGQVFVWPRVDHPSVSAVFLPRTSRGEDSALCLLALAPTASADGLRDTAPHGDWELRVTGPLGPNEQVDVYAARNDRDIGTLLRGRPSRFIDLHEPLRYLGRPADDLAKQKGALDEDADRAPSMTSRRGTTNGIATHATAVAVAGYQRRSGAHAPYSSAGAKMSARGAGPKSASPTDESAALPGMRAAGNVGATTFRLIGTSTAAPQRARAIVNALCGGGPLPRPGPIQAPDDPRDAEDLWGPEGRHIAVIGV